MSTKKPTAAKAKPKTKLVPVKKSEATTSCGTHLKKNYVYLKGGKTAKVVHIRTQKKR